MKAILLILVLSSCSLKHSYYKERNAGIVCYQKAVSSIIRKDSTAERYLKEGRIHLERADSILKLINQ